MRPKTPIFGTFSALAKVDQMFYIWRLWRSLWGAVGRVVRF